jgi:hypothetical protein
MVHCPPMAFSTGHPAVAVAMTSETDASSHSSKSALLRIGLSRCQINPSMASSRFPSA